ncbi:MAG: acetyl-CoA C-acyltransferase, partial [Chloroflexota bacterium]|nr:acetyl-CoA C-acyltransferase [Chloroflexota bacterium]
KGSLVETRPDNLVAYVIQKALERLPELAPEEIEDVMCGCAVASAEQGFNLARAVSILAGLRAPGTTVNRYCSSSLQTTRMAAHAIKAGEGDVFVSAGVESISRYQQGSPDYRNPRLMRGNAEGLADYYISMGETAENVAEREGISREEMDRYACLSQARAEAARASGHFEGEIVSIPLPGGGTFAADECPRPGTTMEVLATLKPAFRENGNVTAGNSCPFSDGAAAVVVMSDRRARELGIRPLARIVSTAVSALEPEYMGLGPIEASKHALRLAGMTIEDVDTVELNEAFAAQVIPSARGLGMDPFSDKLNPFGGAIAFGHPYGMTGARITATLLNGLAARNQTVGLETMCVGGGQGMAMIVERI